MTRRSSKRSAELLSLELLFGFVHLVAEVFVLLLAFENDPINLNLKVSEHAGVADDEFTVVLFSVHENAILLDVLLAARFTVGRSSKRDARNEKETIRT